MFTVSWKALKKWRVLHGVVQKLHTRSTKFRISTEKGWLVGARGVKRHLVGLNSFLFFVFLLEQMSVPNKLNTQRRWGLDSRLCR